ncbi:MAG: hypothetical protein IJQ81_16130 [Oscillibacter sp.]|nr:hypothetical protein [Oscillibacter sp.]
MKNPLKYLKPPCAHCPYKLGLVRALVNPCPQCRANGYAMFEQLRRRNYPLSSRERD